MSAGLIGTGLGLKQMGMKGMADAARLEAQRENTQAGIKAADEAGKKNLIATGAGIGAMAGMQAGSIGGPWGAVIGAGIGFLAGELF